MTEALFPEFTVDMSLFRVFFESCPIGLNLCRLDGRWVVSNTAFHKIIGYTAAEADNDRLTYWQLTPPEYNEAEQVQLKSLSEKGAYGPYTKEFIRKDGTRVPVRLNGFLIHVRGQDYIWSMIEDLSAQEHLREELVRSESFYQSILDQLPVAVFAKDSAKDWSFILWNRTAEETLGLKKENVLGKRDIDLFPKDQSDSFHQKDLEAFRSMERVEIEDEPISIPGRPTRWVKTAKVAFNDVTGKPRYLLGISQEMTKRKEFEEQLKIAIETARKATQAKSQFLSNMSHEIRNPLHAMLGIVDLLAETKLDDTQTGYLRILRNSGKRLLDIVNDILDIERIEAGHLSVNLRAETLSPILHSVADLMAAGARHADLEFTRRIEVPTGLSVHADSGILSQTLMNLIGNAVKFTPTGGRVEFHAMWEEGFLTLTVRDSGIGIAKEKLAQIFEPFEQGDSSVRKKYGGTGLGLAIVQKLVCMLGGQIQMDSQPGKGTTVKLIIPMERAQDLIPARRADPAVAARASTESVLKPLRILFADDSRDNQELVKAILRDPGIEINVYGDGKSALNAFKTQRPDVLLLDIGMPDLDGNETIQSIRAYEREMGWSPTPAVALTGYALPEDIQRAKNAGFNLHLAKPFSRTSLMTVIQRLQKENKFGLATASKRDGHVQSVVSREGCRNGDNAELS